MIYKPTRKEKRDNRKARQVALAQMHDLFYSPFPIRFKFCMMLLLEEGNIKGEVEFRPAEVC